MNGRWMFSMVLFIAVFVSLPGNACGPFFPDSYLLWGKEANILRLTRISFDTELHRILGLEPPKPIEHSSTTGWKSTVQGEQDDLRAALESGKQTGIDEIVQQYCAMRQSMMDFYSGEYTEFNLENREVKTLFDLDSHQALLDRLPKEFELYAMGANAYRANRFEDAEAVWNFLLALPAEQRHFRSVWAAFMMGKSSMFHNPEQAISYFEKTRQLAAEGFTDSLKLAQESVGWQAMAEWTAGKFLPAFHHYMEGIKSTSQPGDSISLEFLCRRILEKEPIGEEIVRDSLCRRVVSLWLTSREYTDRGNRWLGAIQKANVSLEPGEGSQLAWIAYKNGDLASAKQWLSLEKQITPIGYWVQSKLLLYDGKIDEAMQALRQVKNYFLPYQENKAVAELGVLQLGRKEFIEALDAFARAGYWGDAAYVAERVLTADELKNYLKTHKNDDALKSARPDGWWVLSDCNIWQCLNYLLARRLVRENRWDEAGGYFPDTIRPYFAQFAKHVRKGRQTSLPARERAEHLFEAGKLVQEKGMEIMGTETDPDWTMCAGDYDLPGPTECRVEGIMEIPVDQPENLAKILSASTAEKERSRKSAPQPNQRFHYRPMVLSFMWECANLLPDNDPLLARALYTGGRYAPRVNDSPQQAKFYKALIKRCRKLPIGQAAYQENWFPQNGEALLEETPNG